MLWFRKQKVQVPFTDPNWDLVTITDFVVEGNYPRLYVPDNLYWDVLAINLISIDAARIGPWFWLFSEAFDLHLWTIGPVAQQVADSTAHICWGQGLGNAASGANHEVVTTPLLSPCYMRPREKLTIYHWPYNANTRLSSQVATVRQWRIY